MGSVWWNTKTGEVFEGSPSKIKPEGEGWKLAFKGKYFRRKRLPNVIETFYCPECKCYDMVGYAGRQTLDNFDKAYLKLAQKHGHTAGKKMAKVLYRISNSWKFLERAINLSERLDDKLLDLMKGAPSKISKQAIKMLEKGDYEGAVAKLLASRFWRRKW